MRACDITITNPFNNDDIIYEEESHVHESIQAKRNANIVSLLQAKKDGEEIILDLDYLFFYHQNAIDELADFCGISINKLLELCKGDFKLIRIILENHNSVISLLEELIDTSSENQNKKHPTFEELILLGQNNFELLSITLEYYDEIMVFIKANDNKQISFKELMDLGELSPEALRCVVESGEDIFELMLTLNITFNELKSFCEVNLDALTNTILSNPQEVINLLNNNISFGELCESGGIDIKALESV